MFKIRERIGWAFNALLVAAVMLFLYACNATPAPADTGYTPEARGKLRTAFAQAEIEAGLIPRISVDDLNKPIGKDGWK